MPDINNSKLIRSNKASGVGIQILANGDIECSVVVVHKKKSIIDIETKKTQLSSVEEICKLLTRMTPISLTIDGKGVIHKEIEITNEDTDTVILNQMLPNALPADFLIQKSFLNNNGNIVSVIRKNIVEDFISEFSRFGRYVVSISLGPFSLNNIVSLIEDKPSSISCGNYKLKIHESRIASFEQKQEALVENSYRIGSEDFNDKEIVPLSLAFGYFVNRGNQDLLFHKVQMLAEEYAYKKLFIVSGWAFLFTAFVLLLVNYILFDHYSSYHNELSYKTEQRRGLLQKEDTLRATLNSRQEFITQNGFLTSSRQSFYADIIANTIPSGILLSELYIHPLIKEIKEEREVLLEDQIIKVSGYTKRSTDLNNWLRRVSTEDWVDEIEVINYTKKDDVSAGEFTIRIKISTEEDRSS